MPAELDGVYAPGAYQDTICCAELLSFDIDYARFDFFGPDPVFMLAKSPPIPRLATVRGSPSLICSGGIGTYDPPGSCKQASTDGVHAIKPYCWSIWTAFAPRPSRSPLPEVRHPHSRLANKLTITHNTVIFNNGLRFSRFYSKNYCSLFQHLKVYHLAAIVLILFYQTLKGDLLLKLAFHSC